MGRGNRRAGGSTRDSGERKVLQVCGRGGGCGPWESARRERCGLMEREMDYGNGEGGRKGGAEREEWIE
eukprot:3828156-Rhodomonas_salina.1